MCGIAGSVLGSRAAGASALVARMCRTLEHRGPDDTAVWVDHTGRVAIGHRRLSIIDLSPRGRNPMGWADGRLQITYNGEIYNYRELRKELERDGCQFRSQTDTEVVLAAFDRWGPACVQRFIGMFAFAIWDEANRRLFMARDRLGKKPLYYWHGADGRLAFASELKALVADPAFPRTVDSDALRLYLGYGSVPAPLTIYQAARKLPPGHTAVFESGCLRIAQYWDPVAVAVSEPFGISTAEADAQLERLVCDAVKRRMIADVPIGAFLSGGIDSSLVVALMQEVGSGPASTFTVRFDNAAYDESSHAAAVARHLGTQHHEETCGTREVLELIDRLPDVFDEPFADSSAIATCLLSWAARRHVTVVLSGDGGDELFFGYPRYIFANRAAWLLRAPRSIRRTVARVAAALPWRRLRRAADVLRDDAGDPYGRFIAVWGGADVIALGGRLPPHPAHAAARARLGLLPFAARLPVLDTVSYLPDDILTKVDRASMAVGLEVRSPLLDHRVAEFALRLPLSLRTSGGRGKLPLRRLLEKRVPRALIERPKMGFGVPLADWLRGPLRSRMSHYVAGPLLPALGLNAQPARTVWQAFLHGQSDRADLLWSILVLGAWAERWAPDPVEAGVAHE